MDIRRILFYICLGCLVIAPTLSTAAVSLPWSTSFNCTAYTPSTWNVWSPTGECADVQAALWANTPQYTQLVSAANYPGGGGGNGLRYWLYDTTRNPPYSTENSSTMGFYFASAIKEYWIRWYMRYQSGFTWDHTNGYPGPDWDKLLYNYTTGGVADSGWEYADGYIRGWTNTPSQSYWEPGTTTWDSVQGGGTNVSDGSWHCYEVHFKMDTNSANGVIEAWIDGTSIMSATNVNFSSGDTTKRLGWVSVAFNVNQGTPANAGTIGSPAYLDFDDIAISNTGRIGPIGQAIPPPQDLRIVN